MMTGDASVNPQAPILCCTAEILANIALHRGAESDVRAVIMDEFHYYSDAERGYAWQVPLLTMPRRAFPPHVRHARRHGVLRKGNDPRHRCAERHRAQRPPARALGI
jgi:hypothetical protein